MANRGRVPAAARAVSAVYQPVPLGLEPPESLSPEARRVFVDLVSSVDAQHFLPPDITLVCAYAEATAMSEKAAFHLQGDGEPDLSGRFVGSQYADHE